MRVIGIDPGKNGGIAVVDCTGAIVDVVKMPETMQDLLDYLRDLASPDAVCYMESVGFGMPGQSSSATAKFARHCGHLEMALLALGIPVVTVTPNKWEKSFQLGKSGEYTKTEWKNRLKGKAQQLFPSLGRRITLCTCDALLLARYGRDKEVGG